MKQPPACAHTRVTFWLPNAASSATIPNNNRRGAPVVGALQHHLRRGGEVGREDGVVEGVLGAGLAQIHAHNIRLQGLQGGRPRRGQ